MLGDDHPETLPSINNFAVTMEEFGQILTRTGSMPIGQQ
jgi:hypothetical protein